MLAGSSCFFDRDKIFVICAANRLSCKFKLYIFPQLPRFIMLKNMPKNR